MKKKKKRENYTQKTDVTVSKNQTNRNKNYNQNRILTNEKHAICNVQKHLTRSIGRGNTWSG